jgi:hypothetical protein
MKETLSPERETEPPRVAAPVVLGLVGLTLAHGATLASGLRRVQATSHDARLIGYLLEHAWLWLRGAPGHRDFWSAPFYYPARGVVAFSDALLTAAPP